MKIRTLTHIDNLPAGEYEVVAFDQDNRIATLRRGSETKQISFEAAQHLTKARLLIEIEDEHLQQSNPEAN